MLNARSVPGCPARRAATLARATSRTWMKSRSCCPSSKSCGARLPARADRNAAVTPEYGVSCGSRGPYTLA